MTRTPSLVALLLALVLVAAACGDADDESRPPGPPSEAGAGATTTPATSPAPASPTTSDDDPPAASTSTTGAPSTDSASPDTLPPGDPTGVSLALEPVSTHEQPLDVVWRPGDERPWVAEKTGRLYVLDAGEPTLALDLSQQVATDSERGLLGVEFSPDGSWLYVSSTTLDGSSNLAVWSLDGGLPLDPSAGTDLLTFPQPYANHNGGDLALGPDGYLYWALGDGGSAGDPEGNGQDPTTPLGSILRLDPDPAAGAIASAPGNPELGEGTQPAIWLYGLRNPWKISFDRLTGDLWIGDVGQGAVEEIDRIPAGVGGLNLGWNCREGDTDYADCEAGDFHEPTLVYGRDQGSSVTGGFVYRGTRIPELYGAYVFGDFGSGRVWAFPEGGGSAVDTGLRVEALTSFGEDPDGELWAVSIAGEVSRIVAG